MTQVILTIDELNIYLGSRDLKELIIDAEGAVLGRLASYVAKLSLLGYKVHVVNVEKALVSGDRNMVINSYKLLLNVKTHKNPYRHSIKRPRNPILIFKKAVKNMLPKDNWRGVEALKRVKAYIGIPEEFREKDIIRIADVYIEGLKRKRYVTVGEIAKALGWKGEVVNE